MAVLSDEYRQLWSEPPPAHYFQQALDKGQAALCLSGGGIRSASFALGALQALARMGLLTRFQYVSTVSGGGYIGSWLQRWIHAENGDAARVQAQLAAHDEPDAVARLRAGANYLTPQLGLTSADGWTVLIMVLRNLILNWLVFLPSLMLVALVPNLYLALLVSGSTTLPWIAGIVGYTALLVATFNVCVDLPSHERASRERRAIQHWIIWPSLVFAAMVPLMANRLIPTAGLVGVLVEERIAATAMPPLGLALPLFWLTWLGLIGGYVAALVYCWRGNERAMFVDNLPIWTVVAGLSAAFLFAGVPLAQWVMLHVDYGLGQRLVAAFGPLWVTIAHLLCSSLFVGFRRSRTFKPSPGNANADPIDADREWLARISAEKVIPAAMWALLALICLPMAQLAFGRSWIAGYGVSLASLGSAVIVALGGGSVWSSAKLVASRARRWLSLDMLVAVATFFLAAMLMIGLAYAELRMAVWVARTLQARGIEPGIDLILLGHLAVFLGLGILLWATSRRINVNRFSLHNLYRNRLIREFLGSANDHRESHPFTGFDSRDNVRLNELHAQAGGRKVLLPVVNVTMNVTETQDQLAWQERKAAAFTMTPLACGSAMLRPDDPGKPPTGCYVPTCCFGGVEPEQVGYRAEGGIALGGAMTISGAAVSPAMGYHSSPATAFLMTLLNARLGCWLPNPAFARTHAEDARWCRRSRPTCSCSSTPTTMLGA